MKIDYRSVLAVGGSVEQRHTQPLVGHMISVDKERRKRLLKEELSFILNKNVGTPELKTIEKRCIINTQY